MRHHHLRRAALALLMTASSSLMAATWSTAGSAGTVDNDDENYYYTSGSSVGVLTSAPDPATVNVFYNLPQLAGFTGTKWMRWTVRYREGTGARIVLTLRRYDLETGFSAVVDTFDSDSYADTPDTSRVDTRCAQQATWDFGGGLYYVEAALTKPNDSNLAILYGFALESLAACP